MTTAQTVKRAVAAVKAVATADAKESQRLADRRAVREQLGRRRLLEHQVSVLDRRIADLHQKADRAADEHSEACRPVQDQLTKIENEITTAMAAREPIPPGLEEDRAGLLEQIHQHNETLSDAAERVKRLVGPLEKERREIRSQVAQLAACENKLLTLGNPALLAERFANGRRMEHAFARLEEAREAIRRLESGGPLVSINGGGLADWRCEAKHAAAELDATHQVAEGLLQQLLDE